MVRAKALSIKASSRLSNVAATTLVATILAAGCVQSVDNVVGSPTSSAATPADAPSIGPNRTQPSNPRPLPTPTLTVNQQNVIWEHDVRMALADTNIWLLIPYMTAEQLDEVNRRIVIRILCQEHLNRAWEVLEEQLPPLGIPIGLVDVEVSGYVSPTTPPPDACTLTADEVLSTQISEYIASTPLPLPTATPTPEVVPPSHTPSSALNSPTHFAEPAPVPTMTRGLWRAKVAFALDEASRDGSLVESLVTKLNTRAPPGFDHVSYLYDERRVRFYVVCPDSVDEAWQILDEHLPSAVNRLATADVEVFLPEPIPFIVMWDGKPPTPQTDIFRCVPPEVIDPVTGISAPGFGGLFWDREDGIVYIYLLEPSQELGEMLVLEEFGNRQMEWVKEVRVLQGKYTWEQLMDWEKLLDDEPGLSEETNVYLVWLEAKDNRIRLKSEAHEYPDRKLDVEKIKSELSEMGVPFEAIILDEDAE